MQVEILEERLSSDGFAGCMGDRFTVPDDVGAAWCSRGWAKDLAGVVKTGERKTHNVNINPKKLTQKQNAQEAK